MGKEILGLQQEPLEGQREASPHPFLGILLPHGEWCQLEGQTGETERPGQVTLWWPLDPNVPAPSIALAFP